MTFLCRRVRPLLSLLFLLFAFTTFTFASQPASPAAEYDESLDLTPLPPSSLLASFRFAANTSAAEFDQQNFKYFPRSLGQILQHARTKELHLRFALGRWDAESWGSRPWAGRQEGGTGVEIWAWVEADGEDEANKAWSTLTNALSGLFCASLNFIDSTRTIKPVLSFSPSGSYSHTDPSSNLTLLHGTLPREVVCTENLTPFLKLLPCKGKAGISSLLDGHKLFDASWQSMSIDVRPVSDGKSIQITQTVDMVLDIARSKRPRHDPIPRPIPAHELVCDTTKPYHSHDTCFPLDAAAQASQEWSLSQIFGRTLKGSCPLSPKELRHEPVCLHVSDKATVYSAGNAVERKDGSGFKRCFTLSEDPLDSFELVYPLQHTPPPATPLRTPKLYAERSFTGYGAERGGVQAVLTNPSTTEDVEIVYLEALPWFMRVFLHTLKVTKTTGDQIDIPAKELIQEMYYLPAVDRSRGTQLEIRLRIPASSTVKLGYDFEKAILRYTEYPPDANRGFDVPAAVVKVLGPSGEEEEVLRTTSLLLSLPTPDFSMPYNVIIFTSTVMALAFGFVFNLMVRRFVGVEEAEGWNLRAARAKLVTRVKEKLARLQKTRGVSVPRIDVGKVTGGKVD